MNTDILLLLYKKMLRIRCVEEAIASRYSQQKMRCPIHLCIGQEAIAVGICYHLNSHDKVFSGHRAHGHYLAKGGSLNSLIAEMYGYEDGCSKGYGGSMHLTDLNAGFVGSTPIVGGTIPLAVGSAWRSKLINSKDITVVFFGEGCFEEGIIHESMNFAKLHNLPILFVCENNLYSVYTQLKERQAQSRKISDIAKAHGLASFNGDGNDIAYVSDLAKKSINMIKHGLGPMFFELTTYRWLEHCGPSDDDELAYRPEGELQKWKKKCPLKRARLSLEKQVTEAQLEDLSHEIDKEIHQAFALIKNCSKPSLGRLDESVHYA